MPTMDDVVSAWNNVFQRFQILELPRYGLLGDGNGTVNVDGKPGWSWIRYNEDQSKLSQVRNMLLTYVDDGTPVVVGKAQPTDDFEQVLGINLALYFQHLTNQIVVQYATPPHGENHHGTYGADPAPIDLSNLTPGRISITDPVTMSVYVEPFYWPDGFILSEFPGGAIDLTTHIPAVAGTHNYTVVYLHMDDGLLYAVSGEAAINSIPPPIPEVPEWVIPLGIVEMYESMTVVEDGFWQYKFLYGTLGTRTAPHLHNTEAGQGGASIVGLEELMLACPEPLYLLGSTIYPTNAYHTLYINTFYIDGLDITVDLDTIEQDPIWGCGQVLIIRPASPGMYSRYSIRVRHSVGNIWLSGESDIVLDKTTDHLMLIYDGEYWCDVGGVSSGTACCIYSWAGQQYVPENAVLGDAITFVFDGIDVTGLSGLLVHVYQEGLGSVTHVALNGNDLGTFNTADGVEQWKIFTADSAYASATYNTLQFWCTGPGPSGNVLKISVIGASAGGSSGVERSEWLQNGFTDELAVSLAWDDGTRTLTISPSGVSYTYYHDGILYTKSGADTETITDTTGLWAFYFDAGSLESIRNPSHAQVDAAIENQCIAAYVYWNATTNDGRLMYELHGYRMSPITHHWLHDNMGAVYREGMALADFSDVDGDGDQDRDVQFSLSSGDFYDEDIEIETTAIAVSGNMELWYLVGTEWTWSTVTVPGRISGAVGEDRLSWNNAGAQEEVDNASFALAHIFATNITDDAGANPKYIFIQGQNEYSTKSAARTGAEEEINNLVYGTLPLQEIVPVATIILQTNSSYGNSIKSRIVTTDSGDNFVDWRGSNLKGSGGVVSDHGSLAGLADDDHTQYLLEDGTRAMSGNLDLGGNDITNAGAQTENTFWAGPTSAPAAAPAFRALVAADIASLAMSWVEHHIFDNGISIDSNAWRLGGVVYDLDFAGTDYDTKAECQAIGLRFSDSDTPFPDKLYRDVSGSWSHSAGNGWQPASSTNAEGPGILIPLMRMSNWEIEVTIARPVQNNTRVYTFIAPFQSGGHVPFFARDTMARSTYYYRSSGQRYTGPLTDTFLSFHLGTPIYAAGSYITKLRNKNGTFGIWDEQNDTWYDYTASVGLDAQQYGYSYLFIQPEKPTTYTYGTVYLESLKLTYLV